MIRKRILISIVTLTACLVSPFVSADLFPGKLIAGLDVGYSSRSGDLGSNYRTAAMRPGALAALPVGAPLASVSPKISDSGTTVGLLAGYEMQWRDYFFSLEGHVDWARHENVKMHNFRNSTGLPAGTVLFLSEATYIQGTRYGVSGRFGMNVPPFFKPYFRVGGEYSDHEVSITNIFLANPPPLPWDHFSEKKGLWTWLFGAGVEVPLMSDVVGLRLEYNYLPGRHFGFDDSFGALAGTFDIKTRTHAGKLAIVINID